MQTRRRFSDTSKAALSREISGAVRRGETPGAVALVVGRDGVLYQGAAGKLDVAHDITMPVNAIFAIASIYEAGDFGGHHDAPAKRESSTSTMRFRNTCPALTTCGSLPSSTSGDATYETRPAKRPMTIRHLLTHTSGLGYDFSNAVRAPAYRRRIKKNEWELPLLNDPGDKWNYSASTVGARHDRGENLRRAHSKLTSRSTSSNPWAWWIRHTPCRSAKQSRVA